jgi:hypothetical protein
MRPEPRQPEGDAVSFESVTFSALAPRVGHGDDDRLPEATTSSVN